jgi:hypothetical protein
VDGEVPGAVRAAPQRILDEWNTVAHVTGRSPERPAVDVVFGTRLQRHGISAHAGRNTAGLALAANLPASVLA